MFQVKEADNLEEYAILRGLSNSNSNNKHDENSPQIINKQKQAIISCMIML